MLSWPPAMVAPGVVADRTCGRVYVCNRTSCDAHQMAHIYVCMYVYMYICIYVCT